MPNQYTSLVRRRPVERTCEACGTTFLVHLSYLERFPDPTCSRACRWARLAGQKAGLPKPSCIICGTLFEKKRSGRQTCSTACWNEFSRQRTPRQDVVTRFWARVDKDGPVPPHRSEYGNCWPRGGDNGFGYSVLSYNGRSTLATHFAWILASGRPFPPGMWALHVCDNPSCVRADDQGTYEVDGVVYERRGHLWLGDQTANMADAARKSRTATLGRSMPGETHPRAKLTEDDVRQIRLLWAEGIMAQKEIANLFGITSATVSDIVRQRSWKHIA